MLRKLVPALLALGLALPASAQETREEFVFDTYVAGIKIGVVRFNAAERGGNYALAGNMNTAGLVGIFHKMAYDATARGTTRGTSFSPSRYTEKGFSGNWHTDVEVQWRGGIPEMTRHIPELEPAPHRADPRQERGSIDNLTALYAALRAVPVDRACSGNWKLFDGRQGGDLLLRNPKRVGDTIECSGEYRRRSGYSAEELAAHSRFPFTMIYSPGADGQMRVTEVRTASTFGQARMIRR